MSAPCPVHGEHPVHRDPDSAPPVVPGPGSAGPSRPIRNPFTWLLVGLVRGYQLIVSPWFAPTCRYYPSCSAYGLAALREHGAFKGFALTVWRVLRCNPWSKGGVDHVPPRRGRDERRCTCEVAPLTAPPAPARTLVPRNSGGSTTGNPLRGHPAP